MVLLWIMVKAKKTLRSDRGSGLIQITILTPFIADMTALELMVTHLLSLKFSCDVVQL